MTDRIEAYAAFARMMELRSFTAVARELRVSQSTVSKHIGALEAQYGVQLFARSTRRLNPTPEAFRIVEHVQQMLDALDTAQATIRGERPEASGLLRLAVPRSLGRSLVLPHLPQFLRLYPKVSINMNLADETRNLLAEGIDLAITTAAPKEGTLIRRALKVFQWVLVASPKYLAGHKAPRTPVDLEDHDMILSTRFADGLLEFDSEDGRQAVPVRRRLLVNCEESVYEAALSGQGIAVVPSWLATSDLTRKAVVRLLPDYVLPPISVSLVYPQTQFLPQRARAFIDFIVAELAAPRRGSKPAN